MGNAVTVLIIDDEAMIRDLVQNILTFAGFEVLTAETGQSGIRLFAEHHSLIDLILLDLIMDDLPGIETLKKLREISPDVPCIISSGQAPDPREIPSELNANVYFLQKPYRAGQLTDMCHQAMRQAQGQPG